MAMLSAVTGLIGSVVSARGTLAAGKAQQQADEYAAKQLDMKALEERAVGQREAEQYKRNKELALSKSQTAAAASGFSATDPTALALADEIARYGTFQEQMAQYGGKSRRTGYEAQAEGKRLEGKAAMTGARYSAAGTILGGISGFGKRFASAFPSSSTSYRYG